jgi:predicted NACHT family NTPase
MKYISKRSLKASKEGVQLASLAILRFPTKIDFAVELEISRSTVQNFFAGKPVGRENFHKICKELDLDWQEVAELPQQLEKSTTHIPSANLDPSKNIDKNTNFTVDSLVQECRSQIRERIISVCEKMRVLDMSRPVSLENIYIDTQVCETITGRRRLRFDSNLNNLDLNLNNLDLKLTANRVDLGNVQLNCQEQKPQKISGWSAAMRYAKLIVLGKPGSGKTMFLKHLALQCIAGKFAPELVPIFISFRDFVASNSALNLLDYIAWQFTNDCRPLETTTLRQLLSQGKFFIIIDGLDEIKTSDRRAICQHLRRFTEWFPHNRYVISCRHGVEYCNFEQFTEVEIADFEQEQITNFAAKWFEPDDVATNFNFLRNLKKNVLIQELATNPLLLTLLCISFNESASFPSSRSEIYEESLDIMFKQWDVSRSIDRDAGNSLSRQLEKELLCTMALQTFEQRKYLFKEAELELFIANYLDNLAEGSNQPTQINSKKLLKSIEAKHGLLIEQAKKVYSFSHLAFQEYLTARKFVFQEDSPVSTAMLLHLVKHITEERWRDIFLLVAEMLPQADMLFQMMSQQIESQVMIQTANINAFMDWVNCKVGSVKVPYSPATIRAFYFELGLSQIIGNAGSNFSLALSLAPDFSRTINSHTDLVLDLSICHIIQITRSLDSIPRPALTFERIVNRAIAHATKIQPELAEELQTLANKLPSTEEDEAQFWLWWHKQGKVWSNKLNSIAVKYRNIGYQWQFDRQQEKTLKRYLQTNLLLLDCLNASAHVSPEVKQTIQQELLTFTKSEDTPSSDGGISLRKKNESSEIESMLFQGLV